MPNAPDAMRPLSDVRVVDAAQIFAGPAAAMMLADQGADVVKLEPPAGDGCRRLYSSAAMAPFGKAFLALNRNKRSIQVDLKTSDGREILGRLARWADVYITSQLPEASRSLGADFDALSKMNPRLVYGAISAFGPKGAEAGKPGYDLVLQARAGILSSRRMADGTPVTPATMTADLSCSMLLSYAVMTALWERQRTGRGRKIDISLLGSAIAVQAQQLVKVQGDTSPLPGDGVSATASPYLCADGLWLIIVVLADREWRDLCRALDISHLAEEPAFSNYDARAASTPELYEILAAVFATRPRGEWLGLLEAARVPCGPIQERDETFDDPQLRANGVFVPTQHPALGQVDFTAPPFAFSGEDSDGWLRRPAPLPGEHTLEVLAGLGYGPDEAESLLDRGAVLQHPGP